MLNFGYLLSLTSNRGPRKMVADPKKFSSTEILVYRKLDQIREFRKQIYLFLFFF